MPERVSRRRYGSSEMHASRAYVIRNRTPCGYPHSFDAERFPYLYSSFQRDNIFPRVVGYGDPDYPRGRNEFDRQRAMEERAAMRQRRRAHEEAERRRLMNELAELTSHTTITTTAAAASRRAQRVSLASHTRLPSATTAALHAFLLQNTKDEKEEEVASRSTGGRQSACSTSSHACSASRRGSHKSKEPYVVHVGRSAAMEGAESLADTVRQQDDIICRCLSAPAERTTMNNSSSGANTRQGLTSAGTTLTCTSSQPTLVSGVMRDIVVFDSPTSRSRSKATQAALRQAWHEQLPVIH